jgi:signal transduction histidine kinase
MCGASCGALTSAADKQVRQSMENALSQRAPLESQTRLHAAVLAISATGSLYETLLSLTNGARSMTGAHHAMGVFCPPAEAARPLTAIALSSEYERYRGYFEDLDTSALIACARASPDPVRVVRADGLPEASSLNACRRGLAAPPPRTGVVASLASRSQRPRGLIYLSGEIGDDFSLEDAEQLRQFVEIGSSLLELHCLGGAREDSVHPEPASLANDNQQLLRSGEELAHFANVSSYDLQERLRAVIGYCQLVKAAFGATCSADSSHSTHIAIDSANCLQQVISDLLRFEQSRQQNDDIGHADCNRVVADALRNLTALMKETHATVHCDRLPVVRGDLRQLTQLFQNLIDNAITYRSTSPITISISVCESNKEWDFSIRDNGIGIAVGRRERCFTIFQQGRTCQPMDGTGIGLAVCKRIIDRHGGRIWITSNTGPGCTIRFTLPKEF